MIPAERLPSRTAPIGGSESEDTMNSKLSGLLDRARTVGMSLAAREGQRRSFAFGSANIENERITRETVRTAEEELRREKDRGKNVG
jgi:hypothetical protein